MILRWITITRSWPAPVRIGITTAAVAAATALQLPVEIEVPGEPFLLNFIVVITSACGLGRMPGFVAVAASTVVSLLYFEPAYSFKLAHAVDLLAVEAYAAIAALSVEAFCRLLDSAIEANSTRTLRQEAQARLAAIVTSSADAIVGKTLDGIITSWNEAAERMFGYAAGEMIGQSIRRVIPVDRQREEDMILACLARGERIKNYETVRIAKDGRPLNVSVTVSPIRDAEDRIIGASKVVRDITERRRTEELLRRQAHLLDQSHDAIFTWKIGGGIAYWSRGAETLYGYPSGQAIGQSSHELLQTRSAIPMQEVEAQIVRDGGWHGELTHTTRDGRTIIVESRHVRVSYDGETYAFETNRDITARKQAESQLAEREAQLALFIEHAPAAIAMFDDKMRYLAVSRRFLSDYKLPATAGVIGRSHYEVFPDIPQRWREIHARVLAGEELSHEEDPFPRRDGRFELVQWLMKPWRTADGRIGGALLFSQFMTRTLANSEARFHVTFENAAVGIAHVAPDGRLLKVNEALCRFLGYPIDELITKSFQDFTYPDDLATDLAQVELMRQGKIDSYDMDKRYLRKDGTIAWGRLTVGCVRKSDGSIDYSVRVIEDISARKHAEEELHKSEERFRSSLLHSPVPIILFDDQEQILAISQSWLEGSGYSREELLCIEDWTARAYGERSDEVLEHIREIISTEPETRSAEHVVRTKEGRKRVWCFVSCALGTQSDGRRLFVSVGQDVTERNAHEEQVQLLMREINHRAKNMLSLVQAIARQTATRAPEDFIVCFTERIQALAANQDLLVRNEWQGVDVEDLVPAQLAHFADLVGSRLTVHGPKLRLNAAAAQAIGLALHELATNAGKYGALSVDAGRVDVCWRLNDDVFAMSWAESNGPPVSRPKRRGFGSTVVDSMVKQTVNGEVQLDYAPSGVVWNLTCPAVNALERNTHYKNSEPSTRFGLSPARNHVLWQPPTVH